MARIIQNYLFIFILPLLLGAVARFLLRRAGRGYYITLTAAALAVAGWMAYRILPNHGSELYGILALIATSAAAGALLTALLLRRKRAR